MEAKEFNDILNEVKDKMFRLALRIVGDRYEAEDVIQDVIIKIWNKREYFATVDNKPGWCMTLTRNMAIDKTRSKHRRTSGIDQFFDLSDHGATPYRDLEQKDLLNKVKEIIGELPEKQRSVLHLRDIEEYSYDEIAQITGFSANQVKINIYRARQAIKAKIELLKNA